MVRRMTDQLLQDQHLVSFTHSNPVDTPPSTPSTTPPREPPNLGKHIHGLCLGWLSDVDLDTIVNIN